MQHKGWDPPKSPLIRGTLRHFSLFKPVFFYFPVPSLLRRVREDPTQAIRQVAEKFILANCYDPKFACLQFGPPRGQDSPGPDPPKPDPP